MPVGSWSRRAGHFDGDRNERAKQPERARVGPTNGASNAGWLFDAFGNAPAKRDIKISRGTHLMHLEIMRLALWRESVNFLQGTAPAHA
jgi:hypothetical protein